MAGDWISVCTNRQAGWNIPSPAITELTALRGTAATVLETAENETTRTPPQIPPVRGCGTPGNSGIHAALIP